MHPIPSFSGQLTTIMFFETWPADVVITGKEGFYLRSFALIRKLSVLFK